MTQTSKTAARLPILVGVAMAATVIAVGAYVVSTKTGAPAAQKVAAGPTDCGKDAFLPAGGTVSDVETTASGLKFQTIAPGGGASPTVNDTVAVAYRGTLADGTMFDSNNRAAFPVGGVVPGFGEALTKMQKRGSYRMCIPAALGYGANNPPGSPIPPNAVLRFEVDLLDFATPQQMQQMQADQSKGAPTGPAGQ